MEATYKKTQTGWIVILSFIPVLLFLSWIIYYQEVVGKPFGDKPAPSSLYLGLIVFFLLLLALFSTLTVTGFPTYLEIRYGAGLFRKKFEYQDIRSCSIQKNHWFYGWGVRKIPGGWLFNVCGSMSVQLDMKNGKMYRIGTDEPEKLVEFIKSRLSLFGGG
ncbi:MAG: hypothetical protein WCE90_07685 [Candidatus Zixiibacteriota bacterium]